MNIPVRLPPNAFDISRRGGEGGALYAREAKDKRDLFDTREPPHFPPGLRDVGSDLERLLTRLARSSDTQSSRASLGIAPHEHGARASASSVKSTGELNGAATSFEKVALNLGASTAVAQLGGVYKGTGAAAGATAIAIVVDAGAVVGATPSPVAFHVTDQNGASLFSFTGNVKEGDSISLGDDVGLKISFSQGTLIAGESANTRVFRTHPTEVDGNATFGNADANARPRFADAMQVVPGSFTVNGTAIEVGADDNIASVLRRINDRRPDLEATLAGDKVTIASRENGRRPIELGNDTSGFLAATKLQGAPVKTGGLAAQDEPLALSSRFGGISAGSFKMGEATIAIDPRVDTLGTVLARMSAALPGVTAYYDGGEDAVVVRDSNGAASFGDDSSGFLAAIGLDGTREAPAREGFTLAEGTAARLQHTTVGRKLGLVAEVLTALSSADAEAEAERVEALDAAALAETRRTAAKARAAYGREVADAREHEQTRSKPAGSRVNERTAHVAQRRPVAMPRDAEAAGAES